MAVSSVSSFGNQGLNALEAPDPIRETQQQIQESEENVKDWEDYVRPASASWTEKLAEASSHQNAGVFHGVNTFLLP